MCRQEIARTKIERELLSILIVPYTSREIYNILRKCYIQVDVVDSKLRNFYFINVYIRNI